MTRRLYNLLFAIGLLVVLFGVGVDYIMPGASPGLNLPQALININRSCTRRKRYIAARRGIPRRLKRSLRKHGLQALVITLLTLVALEIILSIILGMPTYYPDRILGRAFRVGSLVDL